MQVQNFFIPIGDASKNLMDLYSFLIGFYSMQGWTATMRYGAAKKKEGKDEKNIGKLIRKSPKKKVSIAGKVEKIINVLICNPSQ